MNFCAAMPNSVSSHVFLLAFYPGLLTAFGNEGHAVWSQ